MAATMMKSLSGSGTHVAGAQLSAFGASSQVRLSTTTSKIVAVRAGSNDEGRKPQQMLVALVAAGAALALMTAAPVSPAHAGLFGGDAKVDQRGATAPEFPGNEGTGTKVGDDSNVRNAASSGTPLGEVTSKRRSTAADAVETGIDVNIDPLKTKIGDIDPFKDTLNPIKSE